MHDLYDYTDGSYPQPRVALAEDAPDWDERCVMYPQYGDLMFWYAGTRSGASRVTAETGTATWPDGTTTEVTRPYAVDVYVTDDTTMGLIELFKAVHIDAHPEQSWKLVADLEAGDHLVELTVESLGLNEKDLPAVVDTISPEVGGRRAMHYTAVRARPGRTIAQGASHNPLARQWVRLADAEDGHHV